MINWQYYEPVFEYEQIFQDIEWSWTGHKRFAYDFVRNTKPHVIAELGTHKGTSYFSMCQAVKDGDLSTNLSAVDTWIGDSQAGFYDESVFTEVNKIVNTYYQSVNTHLIRKTFDEACGDFKNSSIDLLHIDGLHTYQAVKHDLDTWLGKVKPTGTILFHDTNEKKDDFGVYQLWDELKSRYKHIEFLHSHGLGVLMISQDDFQIANFQSIWQRYYDLYYKFDVLTYENINNLQKIESQATEIASQAKEIQTQAKAIELQDKIFLTQSQIYRLEADLSKIKSAKFFKLWQGYNSVKKLFN